MEGKLPFEEALRKRLEDLRARRFPAPRHRAKVKKKVKKEERDEGGDGKVLGGPSDGAGLHKEGGTNVEGRAVDDVAHGQ